MVLPIIGAVAGAGLSMASSAIQTSAQNDATRAQNQASVDNYKAQLRIRHKRWIEDLNIYSNKLGTYNNQLKENEIAASKAYASQQTRLNNLYKSYAFGLQDAQLKRVAETGKGVASGRSGRSIQRLDQMAEGVFMRAKAKGLATLKSGNIAYDTATRNISDQLRISNRNAWTNVAIAPLKPLPLEPPIQQSGVSSSVSTLGMLSSGISGGLSGYNFGTGLEDAFNG